MAYVDAPPRKRLLLASIHDVSPRFEREVETLVDCLATRLGEARFAMLVVPDHWDGAPLAAAPAFQAKLRRWADAGVEMFVHGWRHRDDGAHAGLLARWKASNLTASEGEFLGLTRAEALARMTRGRALLEDVTGHAAAGFIAPAWLYGAGTHAALADAGFALAEDHFRVWRPADGAVLARGPVVTWASRSAARRASSRAFAAASRLLLRPLEVLRIAVHPGDTHQPVLLTSIDATLAAASARRHAGRYRDLLAA